MYDNEVYEYFKITLSHCKKSSRNTPNSTAMSAGTILYILYNNMYRSNVFIYIHDVNLSISIKLTLYTL